MFDDTDEIKKIIKWFSKLPSTDQARIISQFFKDHTKLPKEERENLLKIIGAIQNKLNDDTEAEIVKGLIEKGMEEAFYNKLTLLLDRFVTQDSKMLAVKADKINLDRVSFSA
jgi:predicted transcriptional regulator YheO